MEFQNTDELFDKFTELETKVHLINYYQGFCLNKDTDNLQSCQNDVFNIAQTKCESKYKALWTCMNKNDNVIQTCVSKFNSLDDCVEANFK
eukprot:TRINITY_DN105092_c0_g1_i1.p1 TRINITY_DN105092_c0_g1~~TRINITY_DN105092_c0_g1_i1.p1  ORF type:complete len:91 (-),score=3.54 TRINITY_DN105092_c0_g1_i1:44-316(-)